MPDAEPNQEQRDYWNTTGAPRWVASQELIDRDLERVTAALYAFANARPGERVLDVGCGFASTSLELRVQVGENGAVVGVDIAEPMIEAARKRPGAERIAFVVADAATYAFEPTFDLVFSRFGTMFFADPVAAFANLRTALAPEGRLAFVCWRPLEDNPWARVPLVTAEPLLPPEPPKDPHAPGPFAFADGDRVRRILTDAGFRDIRVDRHDTANVLGQTAEETADHVMTIGLIARRVAEVDDATREQIRARLVSALQPFVSREGVTLQSSIWLVGAR